MKRGKLVDAIINQEFDQLHRNERSSLAPDHALTSGRPRSNSGPKHPPIPRKVNFNPKSGKGSSESTTFEKDHRPVSHHSSHHSTSPHNFSASIRGSSNNSPTSGEGHRGKDRSDHDSRSHSRSHSHSHSRSRSHRSSQVSDDSNRSRR